MDLLKKIFPLSFKYTKDITSLIIGIIVHLVVLVVGGFAIWVATFVPIIGWLIGALGGVLVLYVAVGVVLQILAFLKVIK